MEGALIAWYIQLCQMGPIPPNRTRTVPKSKYGYGWGWYRFSVSTQTRKLSRRTGGMKTAIFMTTSNGEKEVTVTHSPYNRGRIYHFMLCIPLANITMCVPSQVYHTYTGWLEQINSPHKLLCLVNNGETESLDNSYIWNLSWIG